MRKVFTLAQRGRGYVSPNPMVGCIIVKKGRVIAEGYHRRFGDDHAELVALKKTKVKGSTMYVNLEPCCHTDKKTPPCVNAVISSGVRRVVIAMKDPNPRVNGRSIKLLRDAGIIVDAGCLETEARALNEIFIKYITTGMPFAALKAAVSLDGMISKKRGTCTWLTSSVTDRYSHHLRAYHDAILVGVNTVLIDNPHLGCRLVKGRDPLRIILDSIGRTPPHARVMRDSNVMIVRNSKPLKPLLRALGRQGIASVLVEGGAAVFTSFMNEKLIDKVYIFLTPKLCAHPDSVSLFTKIAREKLHLMHVTIKRSGADIMLSGYLSL